MSTNIQMKEHVKEARHDGALYLGYAVPPENGCDGCFFVRNKSCTRPLDAMVSKQKLFWCSPQSNQGTNIIWVQEVTA